MKNIPKHLGVILDGNRSWAKERGLPSLFGHRKGAGTAENLIRAARKRGIKVLTLFVFSTENWKRSKKEVIYLMQLLGEFFDDKYIQKLNKGEIRVKIIGQLNSLPKLLRERIKRVEVLTKKNKKMTLNFAISYGGRAEIVEAFKSIIKKRIPPDRITEKVISDNLWTTDLDLIIRTGKQQRISNFLIWQAAYSELYFCNKYWPAFTEKDLDKALKEYSRRKRKFGR